MFEGEWSERRAGPGQCQAYVVKQTVPFMVAGRYAEGTA